MVKVWKLEEVATHKTVNNEKVALTNDERNALLTEWNAEEQKAPAKKLSEIKSIRLRKLQETDYLSNSDMTMPDYIKTWRQTLRDIPANHTDEDAYDLLLERNADGSLKHSVWTQPTS
jgi:hypothetical protein|tara:strand:- start:277 stop:630 length:354 start_codon:yes stop_codon:yes gene_type:complete